MDVQEHWLTAPSGQRLFYRRWPEESPPAVVAIAHGFGEHGGRYGALVARLHRAGIEIYAVDHRGHGRSPGRRGHVASWGEYRDDLGAFLDVVRSEHPARPLFLLGHSMGALIAVDYVLHGARGLKGVIASAIGLRPAKIARAHQLLLVRLLSRIAPTMRLSAGGIDGSRLSSDAGEIDAYRADPLVHAEATLSWGREALSAIDRVRRMAPRLEIPILVTHGGADALVLPEGSRELYQAAGHADKELKIYPGALHEPHNDLGREAVVEDLAAWILARSGNGSPP